MYNIIISRSILIILIIFFGSIQTYSADPFNIRAKNGNVIIKWSTEDEAEGYNILRSEDEVDGYVQINIFMIIPSIIDIQHKELTYSDSNATVGILYYYKIEKINKNGESNLLGPIFFKIPLSIM